MLSFKRSCETTSERHKFARYLCVEEKGRYLFAEELKLCCRCCGCPTFPCRFPWPVGWPDFAGLPAANLLFTIFDALRARTPIWWWSIFDGVLLFLDPHVISWFPRAVFSASSLNFQIVTVLACFDFAIMKLCAFFLRRLRRSWRSGLCVA